MGSAREDSDTQALDRHTKFVPYRRRTFMRTEEDYSRSVFRIVNACAGSMLGAGHDPGIAGSSRNRPGRHYGRPRKTVLDRKLDVSALYSEAHPKNFISAWRNRPAHVDESSQWRAQFEACGLTGDSHDD